MTPKLKAWAKDTEALAEKQNLAAQFQREQMVQRHRHLREQLNAPECKPHNTKHDMDNGGPSPF